MEAVKNLPPSVCSNSFLKKCVSHDRLKSFYFQNSSPKSVYSGYTKLVYNGYTTTLRSSKMPIIADKVSDHDQEGQIRSTPSRGRSRVIADDVYNGSKDALLSTYCKMATTVAAAALIMLQSCSPVCAEEVVITFPGSNVQEVNTVQRTLVEAWGIVRESYVDPTFNKQDWDLKLRETMAEILPLKTADVAYSKIKGMLATLGDPFTRIVSPKEYESFRINNDGSLQGVGLLLGTDRSTGRLVVLSSIEGGPAARAGILTGDEIVQINDEVVKGANGEDAASKLRGQAGTSVSLTLRRQVPNGSLEDTEIKEIKLQRETISLSPVFTARLPHFKSDGHMMQTGYIRLSTFSQNAAADMRKAISELENDKVESYILDLRNNPGGLVKAGLDVAQMWLDGDETLVNTIDRDGTTFPINTVNGHALTHDPLVVLVNEGSASATEILAGALHDNGRAILVGKKTFGKGKIQSVSELRDGSALFVTVAKYLSPSFHQIDQVGIVPDVQCSSDDMLNLPRVSQKSSNQEINSSGANALVATLEDDSCILTAEHELDLF